ncbi:MAG: tyrosine-type recombinase/integrase [Gammaproteobacteria bacterium]|nr:tyrosine-type recombinase/integrase [Gammaproteobacteria bacterium]
MARLPCPITAVTTSAAPAAAPFHPVSTTTDPAIADLVGASISPNTRRSYLGALDRLDAWLNGRPVEDGTLADWIAHLHGQGLSAATASLAVAAARFRSRMSGQEDPAGPVTGRTLAGIRRSSIGRGRGQVAGVTWEMADEAVAEAVEENTLRGLRDAALVAVASDGLLRVSEVVAINADDIERDPDGSAVLHIQKSKTDQEGMGATCYLGPRTVAVLDAWMESAGIGVNGEGFDREDKSVFRSVRKGGAVGSRLSDRSARAIITCRCGDPVTGRVSGHSLRVGSAISLARAGASLVELQQAGRWKSPDMPARYTRGETARRGPVARLRHGQENGRRPAAADPLEVGDLPVPASEEKENGEARKEPGRDAGGGPCAEPCAENSLTPGIRSNGVKTTDSTTLRKACHAGSPPRARESSPDRMAERYWPSGAMSIPVGAPAPGPPAM